MSGPAHSVVEVVGASGSRGTGAAVVTATVVVVVAVGDIVAVVLELVVVPDDSVLELEVVSVTVLDAVLELVSEPVLLETVVVDVDNVTDAV